MVMKVAFAGTICALLLFVAFASPQSNSKEADGIETIVLGPISVGSLLKPNASAQSILKQFPGNNLAENAIVDSLNKTNVFVIDKKTKNKANWEFLGANHNYPRVAVEGTLWHKFDAEGKVFSIRVEAVNVNALVTDCSVRPARRKFFLSIAFRMESQIGQSRTYLAFSLENDENIAYDVIGKEFQFEPIRKQLRQ